MRKIASMLMGAALAAPVFAADVYDLDAAHTTIGFSAKHLMVSSTKGVFDEFTGTIEVDPADLTTMKASAKIAAKSINTKNQKRDDHLRGPDFFEVAKYPDIKFETTKVEKSGEEYILTGNLTMKDVTKEISFPIEISGFVTDPWGNQRMGFEGSTKINRKDWHINFSGTLDNGGVVVSDDIKLDISAEGIKRK
jgi:polyisoprenoid-binding protein YceI